MITFFIYNRLKNISYPKRIIVTVITIKKKTRINLLPFNIASLAPKIEPTKLHTAMGNAYRYRMWPLPEKKIMEPILVATFTSLACALAFKKSNPKTLIKKSIKKLPAPGPIKPS